METNVCKATVATSIMYAVKGAGTECSGAIELRHQTNCRGLGVDVRGMGSLQILKDKKELGK